MGTPTLDDTAQTVRDVTIPETEVIRPVPPTIAPEGRARLATRGFWLAIGVLAVLLVAAIATIAWQQDRVSDKSAELAAIQRSTAIAQVELAAAQGRVMHLERSVARAITDARGFEREVERLRALLGATRGDVDRIASQLDQTRTDLAAARADLAGAQADVAVARAAVREARGDLLAIAGTPLADGGWTGRIFMMGGTQTPPMLAFDEMKLFTGDDAIEAMIQDGTPREEAERCDEYCVYWRNPSTGWRIMTIDPDAVVTLQSFRFAEHGGFQATTMGIEKFTRIYNGTAPWNAHLAHGSYRIAVVGGSVTSIEEMNLSP